MSVDKGGISGGMGRSSDERAPFGRLLRGRQVDGAPVYGYAREAGAPPVTVSRFEGAQGHGGLPARPHAHDFLVLGFVERGTGRLRVDARTWEAVAGDLFVVAPGEVVAPALSGDLA